MLLSWYEKRDASSILLEFSGILRGRIGRTAIAKDPDTGVVFSYE